MIPAALEYPIASAAWIVHLTASAIGTGPLAMTAAKNSVLPNIP
jgi:hypothetical protein